MAQKVGLVFAISSSPEGGVPKYNHDFCAVVEKYGIRGDYHNREMRPSFSKPGTIKPNDRQISLLAREVLEEMNTALSGQLSDLLQPGSLGENITTEGLGDLSDIEDGALLRIGEKVLLRVIEQNDPCKILAVYSKYLVKEIMGKRGLVCTIEEGAGSRIILNDPVWVL